MNLTELIEDLAARHPELDDATEPPPALYAPSIPRPNKTQAGYYIGRLMGRQRNVRGRNVGERANSTLWHAVAEHDPYATALCGAQRGRTSNGFAFAVEGEDMQVTCKRCLARMGKAQ